MTNKTILMTSIIVMTFIFGITANYAFAADNEVQPVKIVDSDGEFHAWKITGADAGSVLLVTLCDPMLTFDPVLGVKSPSIFKFNNNNFGCGLPSESAVTYGLGEVENGCWVTQSRSFTFLTAGQYTLTLDLQGSGAITPLGTVNSLDDCPDIIDVDIDIKPGSFTNSINTKSKGVVPVAILGSDTLDVFDVDVSTLAFGDDGASPVHVDDGVPVGHYEDVNDDEFIDLVTHYMQKETGIECDDTAANLIGALINGTSIGGIDSVNPKGCRN